MKKVIITFILGIVTLTGFFSCGVDRWPEYRSQIGRDLWIDSLMRQEYLWYEDMPSTKDLNYFIEPEEFFKKVLSPKDKGYSTIDTLDNEPVLNYGFNYTLYKLADNDTVYNALITYVIPGSPAADAGLERGHWLMMMDKDYITKRNEEALIMGNNKEFVVGKYTVQKDEEGEDVGVIQPIGEVTVDAARVNTDVPIHTSYVYTNVNGKTVAYLFYSSFTAGTETNSQKYNNQLRALFSQLKASGIDEFILDLRYNSGGEMECAQLLSTMLAPADRMNNSWAVLKYNDKQVAKNRELALNPELIQSGDNLNLSKVYILTSNETAAASEMVINCLCPYMDVVLIGGKTKGESVATETFTNTYYNWAIHPVVSQVYNSKGESDYANGFTPKYSVDEFANLSTFLPFGNQEEALLNTALRLIVGETLKTEALVQNHSQTVVAVKSVNTCRKMNKGLRIKE